MSDDPNPMDHHLSPSAAKRLAEELASLPDGSCFARCWFFSRIDRTAHVVVKEPRGRDAIDMPIESVRTNSGEVVALDWVGQRYGAGWVLSEVVKFAEDGESAMVRMYNHRCNCGEISLPAGDVIAKPAVKQP